MKQKLPFWTRMRRTVAVPIRPGLLVALGFALYAACTLPPEEPVSPREAEEQLPEVIEQFTPSSTPTDTRKDVVTPIDLETAKALALEAAKTRPDIDFPPDDVSAANLEHPYFQDYHFVYVWGLWHHDINSPFSVSPEGDVFKLPEEFNQLVHHRGLALANLEDAQTLLDFYLEFQIVWPGFDRHHILQEIMDIPGIEEDEDVMERYRSTVIPADISSQESGWTFEFFTWRIVGGALFRWKVHVSHSGEIEVENKEQLETEIGDYIVIE
jgi:hypothetical protein